MAAEPVTLPVAAARPTMPAAPHHLSPVARKFWRSVLAEYELEPHHLAILAAACEALDRTRRSPSNATPGPRCSGRSASSA